MTNPGPRNSPTATAFGQPFDHEADRQSHSQKPELTPVPWYVPGFRSGADGRDVAAYLCRRYTTATRAELSERFGLGHSDSSPDLVKRARKSRESHRDVRRKMARIEKQLAMKPESRA